jgi:pyruvate/2-oxoglutarate dehydrogenase complex dihydrolipoamide acyltransferase (E2) component
MDAVDKKDAERNAPSVPVKNSAGEEVVTGAEDLGVGQVQAMMDVVHNQGFYGGVDTVSSVDTSLTAAAVSSTDDSAHATDAAEALAEELGVDLSNVEGSGVTGDILVSDVKAAAEAGES